MPFWSATRPRASRRFDFCRARTSTSAPPAPALTTPATIRRAQRRGERKADGSQSASSSTAASVTAVSRRSIRSPRSSGGSTGTSAPRSSRSTSLIAAPSLFELLLELTNRAVDQHLGGALRAAQRPRYLLVVHVECEAHDQRLATVVGQRGHAC